MKTAYVTKHGLDPESVKKEGEYGNIMGVSVSLLIIWLWCVSINLRNCINQNQKILEAEVLDVDQDSVTRKQSKQNLNAVLR